MSRRRLRPAPRRPAAAAARYAGPSEDVGAETTLQPDDDRSPEPLADASRFAEVTPDEEPEEELVAEPDEEEASPASAGCVVKVQYEPAQVAPYIAHLQSLVTVHHPSIPSACSPAGAQDGGVVV